MSGPFDFTPGVIQVTYPQYKKNNRVNTTAAKQLAMYVDFYSPLQMAADLPENYEKYPDLFQFILDVPTDWEETHMLNGEIGEYVTIARKQRGGEDWYVGSMTNEKRRDFDLPLKFLGKINLTSPKSTAMRTPPIGKPIRLITKSKNGLSPVIQSYPSIWCLAAARRFDSNPRRRKNRKHSRQKVDLPKQNQFRKYLATASVRDWTCSFS